jgi:hypothetical protein
LVGQVFGVEIDDVVDMDVEDLLTAADRGQEKGGQKLRVEVVANDLGSVDLYQIGAPFEQHNHSIDLLECFRRW